MGQALVMAPRRRESRTLATGMGLSAGLHLLLAAALLLWPWDLRPAPQTELAQKVRLVELPPPPPPPPAALEKPRPLPSQPAPARHLPAKPSRPVSAAPSPPSTQTQLTGEEMSGPVGEAIGTSGPVLEQAAARGRVRSEPSPEPAYDWSAYHGSVWGRIQRVKTYPVMARRKHWEGRALVAFVIDARGGVKQARLADSTGFALLDQEALDTVRRAAPYPTPPAIPGDGVRMEVAIVFELN